MLKLIFLFLNNTANITKALQLFLVTLIKISHSSDGPISTSRHNSFWQLKQEKIYFRIVRKKSTLPNCFPISSSPIMKTSSDWPLDLILSTYLMWNISLEIWQYYRDKSLLSNRKKNLIKIRISCKKITQN